VISFEIFIDIILLMVAGLLLFVLLCVGFLLDFLFGSWRFLLFRWRFLLAFVVIVVVLLPFIILFLFVLVGGQSSPSQMRLGLLVLFVLLVDDLFVLDFEFLLLHVGVDCGWGSHLGHVEDLEHGVEVEMVHV
jgi:hypothetical protein